MYKKFFINRTNDTYILLVRYFLVASAAFAVDFGLLIILKELFSINYLIAATLSFCSGVVVNFYLSTKWIFLDPKFSKKRYEFTGVLLVAFVGLLLNDLILWLLTSEFGLYYIYSKLFATGIIFFWNFFVRKKLLYTDN